MGKYFIAVFAILCGMVWLKHDDSTIHIWMPKRLAWETDTVAARVPTGQQHTPQNITSFPADIPSGTIGASAQMSLDNPYDNIFHIQLPDLKSSQQVYLQYELFGVANALSVVRSINDAAASGGHFVALSQKWTLQKERLSLATLRAGDNVIRFAVPEGAGYNYQVRNVSLILDTRSDATEGTFAHVKGIYRQGKAYLKGYLPHAAELFCNGIRVSLHGNEFEMVVPANSQEGKTPKVLVQVRFANGRVETQTVALADAGAGTQIVDLPVRLGSVSARYQPKSSFTLSSAAATITLPAGALRQPQMLSVLALRQIDLPPLNPDLTNVTAHASGFRFSPHGTKLLKAATIAIPFDSAAIPEGYTAADVRSYGFDEFRREWIELPLDTVQAGTGIVVSKTSGFQDVINGIIKVPESPQTQGYTPTTIKDMKAANPSSGITLMTPPKANAMGSAAFAFEFKLPKGRQSMQPALGIRYDSDKGNGWMGIGWDLSLSSIGIDTRWGVPRYSDALETETYTLNGAQLAPITHKGDLKPRIAERIFHPRVEGSFDKIIRHGNHPSNYWWEVVNKNGTRHFYGGTPTAGSLAAAVLKDASGNIAYWALVETRDLNDNFIHYQYQTVSDAGVAGGTVPGTQLYPSTVTYTGKGTEEGLYEVEFIRDRQLNEARRKDVEISGRQGFKMVTADLLRKVNVKYNAKLIRSYVFSYGAGPFSKTLLKDVSELDAASNIFYTHRFDYYDEVSRPLGYAPFAPAESWTVPSDDVKGDISHALPGFTGEASLLSSTKSSNSNHSLAVTFGLWDWHLDKRSTVGGSFGGGSATTDGLTTLVDVNGDGLPDKVFKKNGQLSYRPNLGGALHRFGPARPVNGIGSFNHGRSSTNTKGIEVDLAGLIFWGRESSQTTNTTTEFLSDFNGDGLLDIASGGNVFFNRLNASGDPLLLPNSTGTPSPIIPGGNVNPVFLAPDPALQAQQEQDYPLQDAIRFWEAPFTGTIHVTAPVRLLDMAAPGVVDSKLDGVRASIQLSGNVLWSIQIPANDFATKTPTLPTAIAVQKGQRLYFRLQSIYNGNNDVVNWDPIIEYTTPNLPLMDADGRSTAFYQASSDFILHNNQPYPIHKDGQIGIDGVFTKGITSDTVELLVVKKTGSSSNIIIRNIYGGLQQANQAITYSGLPVAAGDSLFFILHADSHIDRAQLHWTPHLQYTAFNDATPVTSLNGQPTIETFIVPDNENRNDWSAKTIPLVTSQQDTIAIFPDLSGSAAATGDVVLTVKGIDTLYAKKTIHLNSGIATGPADSIPVIRKPGDVLFCEYHTADRPLALALQNVRFIRQKDSVYLDTTWKHITVRETLPAGLFTSPAENYLGSMFRGWGHFSFKGDPTNAPLDETKITVNNLSGYSSDPNLYTDTSRFDQINNIAGTDFIPMHPENPHGAYFGFDSSVYVTGQLMGSARLWMHDVSVDSLMAGANLRAVNKISETKATTYALGLARFVNANATTSSSSTVNTLDMMDMNGDQYPDVLHINNIQYTLPNGGLESASRTHGLGSATFNGKSDGVSLGWPGPKPGDKPITSAQAQAAALNASATVGLSISGNANDISDEMTAGWLDVNGDGLPDKLYKNGNVAMNLGYRFAPAENWGVSDIDKNGGSQFGAGAGIGAGAGFNFFYGSFQGGFGLLRGNNDNETSFEDVNGDGLVDKLRVNNGLVFAQLNTGNGFAPAILWQGMDAINKNNSTGQSVNFAVTITIPIPILFFPAFKICINPSYSSGDGVSRQNDQLADVDGDGFPDMLHSSNDGNLTVQRSLIGRTNLLRQVRRPMGGSFVIDYERMGNTYEMPKSKWVMKSLTVADGLAGDGADTLRSSFTYAGGHYNRDEREFYGFASVSTHELNTLAGNVVYRTQVQQLLNADYYSKGLLQREWVEDAAGAKFSQTNYQYDLRVVQDSVRFPALIQKQDLYYEGSPTAGAGTTMQFGYDALGNMNRIVDAGDGTPQDAQTATITYHDNNAAYIKNIPANIEVTTVEGLKRKRATNIDSKGNVTQIRFYLATGPPATYDLDYDTYGNLAKITRPENYKHQRMWYRYSYDNSVHTYVTSTEDAFGYSDTSRYDFRFGVLTETISENGEHIVYTLDDRGRLVTVTGPYELAARKPYTIIFDYHPEAPAPYATTRHYDPEFNADIPTVTFMDGLERVVQIKKQVSLFKGRNLLDELKMVVSGKIIYDAFGRAAETRYPVTEDTTTQNILNTATGNLLSRSTFDVLDRTLTTTLADGAATTKTYGITNGYLVERTSDPLHHRQEVFSDTKGRQRLVNVLDGPAGTITTHFDYNALSELLRVTDVAGNAIEYVYDNLGRKTSTRHPDAGLTELVYDLAGNVVQKITPQIRKEIPNGGAIQYQYEFERLTDIDYPRQFQNKVKYTYGKPGTGAKAGRLILQEDASGGQEFFYGKLGEVIKTIRTVMVNTVFATTYVSEQEYDTWNRVKKMTYADSEIVYYHYNRGGSLRSIDGNKLGNTYKYVNQLGYNEYDQRVYLQYGNNTETTYSYDSLRRRLSHLQAATGTGRLMMNNVYAYDAVDNVLSVTNSIQATPGKLGGFAYQSYQYDNLYRLTRASGEYKGSNDSAGYSLAMEYDNLYNITHKRLDRSVASAGYDLAYKYESAAPHQATQIGNQKYSYDQNGNQLSRPRWQNFWDEENRLMAVINDGILSRYTYDAGGERVIKSSGGIQGTWVNGAPAGLVNHDTNYTVYVSPYLVCRRTSFTKHIYIEGQRIATKIGLGSFTNISFPQAAITAGGIDYLKRAANIEKQRYDYYANLNGLSPGPPTDKYFYAHPYNSGIPAPVIIDSTASSIPFGWPGNTTPPTTGPPIYVRPPSNNDSVHAGYGFRGTGHFEENHYFYHPDHLGSSAYITNILGEVSQHQEYVPFGETFFDEHNSSYTSPYLFNAKERDAETGLYYYGARYYEPRTSIWISMDPMADKFPSLSPYNYCLNNPVKLVDPDGRENIPALVWAAQNMANKEIKSNYGSPYFGNDRWSYNIGTVPDRTVCYESCFMAYLNSGESALATLRTGFTNKNNGFKGRTHESGGMNWFKAGDGSNRKFEIDITKGQLGDIVFMGEDGNMQGHAVLLASGITMKKTEIEGKAIETAKFYALSTSSDTDPGSYGGREFTFIKQRDGSWARQQDPHYTFRGYGQLTNTHATLSDIKQAIKLIDEIKKGN